MHKTCSRVNWRNSTYAEGKQVMHCVNGWKVCDTPMFTIKSINYVELMI